jgi:hypothetical protein
LQDNPQDLDAFSTQPVQLGAAGMIGTLAGSRNSVKDIKQTTFVQVTKGRMAGGIGTFRNHSTLPVSRLCGLPPAGKPEKQSRLRTSLSNRGRTAGRSLPFFVFFQTHDRGSQPGPKFFLDFDLIVATVYRIQCVTMVI